MEDMVFIATTGHGLARAASANGSKWQVETMLSEEDLRCLALDPSGSGLVYAGTQGNGVFRSDDAGESWHPSGLEGLAVKSLAVSSHDPQTVYAGVKGAYLYISKDGGQIWQELEGFRQIRGRWLWWSPAEPPFIEGYVQAITISPTDPNVVMAGIEFGAVIRSEDGGQTWSNHKQGSLRDCHSMTFHATNGDWVYEAGGTGGGVALSRDGGQTWRKHNDGLDRNYGWACAADPEQPEIWYASLSTMGSFPNLQPAAHIDGQANAYIFRSSGGAPWEKLTGGLPEPLDYMAYALITIPGSPGHLYAGLANGDVWHSTNHGDSWNQLPFNLGGIHRDMVIVQR